LITAANKKAFNLMSS